MKECNPYRTPVLGRAPGGCIVSPRREQSCARAPRNRSPEQAQSSEPARALAETRARGARDTTPEAVGAASHPAAYTHGLAFLEHTGHWVGEARRHNLPASLTSFVGREAILAEALRLVESGRLLTLIGSGGIGKTRLALRIAHDLVHVYPDGVWLVDLAPVADPLLVPLTVAATLGVQEQPGRTMPTTLAEHLAARRLLLILDNCEHLVPGAADLSETLLRACPSLQILATSRQALGVEGETVLPVPSLSLPAVSSLPDVDHLAQFEAIRLFVDRARATASALSSR